MLQVLEWGAEIWNGHINLSHAAKAEKFSFIWITLLLLLDVERCL